MSRSPLFIRVDASPDGGFERFARCLTIAAALQRRRRPVYFLSNLTPNSLAMTVKRGGNEWIAAADQAGTDADLKSMLQEVRKRQPAAVLVDAEVDRAYLDALDATGTTVVSIDHLGYAATPARLLVNPLLGPGRDNFEFARGAQLLMGRRYAMVRPEVRRQRAGRAQEPPPLAIEPGTAGAGQFRALLALGEDDPHRQVMDYAKLLLNTPKVGKVDIILRREHPDLDALQSLAEANPDRLDLALDPVSISAKIIRCHFALTSGSGWSLELACVGVPQLLILQNEAHWPNAQRLEEEGCASVIGWHESVSAGTIRSAITNLLADPLERQAMARCGRKLIDGRGPDRFVNALEIMLSPSRLAGEARQAA